MTTVPPSMTEVLRGQLFLGNLSAALSAEQIKKHSITHILSVCPDCRSTGAKHLTISVEDSEYEDLLIHLPKACGFIGDALQQGGRVLVHCVMGVSRSTTVVAAFLMKSRGMTPPDAIRYLKDRRPQIHPNYGFIKQLDVFAKCDYDPCPSHPTYRSWKRRHEQDVTYFLNHMVDTVSIIPEKLLLSSDFPTDPAQAQSLLLDLRVTHFLTISPANIPSAAGAVVPHRHFVIDNASPESLLLSLPAVCSYIYDALRSGGLVLVHSARESRGCVAVCAYLMATKRCSPFDALDVIEHALPLFHRTPDLSRILELYQACGYVPTPNHPAFKNLQISSTGAGTRPVHDLGKTANAILSETAFDLGAFSDALNSIQNDALNSQSIIRVR